MFLGLSNSYIPRILEAYARLRHQRYRRGAVERTRSVAWVAPDPCRALLYRRAVTGSARHYTAQTAGSPLWCDGVLFWYCAVRKQCHIVARLSTGVCERGIKEVSRRTQTDNNKNDGDDKNSGDTGDNHIPHTHRHTHKPNLA